MNTIDIVILCLMGIGFMIGYRRGLILQAVHFVGFIVAYIVAYLYYRPVAQYLQSVVPYPFSKNEGTSGVIQLLDLEQMFYAALAFALLFFGTKIVLNIVGHLLTIVASLPGLNMVNRWLGGVLGFLQAFVVLFVLVHVMIFMPWQTGQEWIGDSSIATWMASQTTFVSDQILEMWKVKE